MKNIIVEYLINNKLDQKLTLIPAESMPLVTELVKAEEVLLAALSDEHKAMFKKYVDAALDYRCEQSDYYFTEGFKAGILFGLEIKT